MMMKKRQSYSRSAQSSFLQNQVQKNNHESGVEDGSSNKTGIENDQSEDNSLLENKRRVDGTLLEGDTEDKVAIVNETSDRRVSDGGWGWVIVLGCVLLRIIIGGIGRSSPLFYIKFLERFDGTAAQTAWVTSLAATVRLLLGPVVSVLCNRFSCRKLVCVGAIVYVVSVHVSGYATSLTFLYMTYGILGGLGRSFLLTPCTILLSQYFNKKASLAFGLASSGFGIGGFVATPIIEILFQAYGFNGTFVILSGVACHLFVCVTLFKSPTKSLDENQSESETEIVKNDLENEEDRTMLKSRISSTGSVHLIKARVQDPEMMSLKGTKNEGEKQPSDKKKKTKWISFSILKDIRFVTLCFATFLFSVPSSNVFLAALAGERGVTDFQSAYILSITAGCDTVTRIMSGFILDFKSVRPYRAIIYNVTSFLQGVTFFLIPVAQSFWQFACFCGFRGILMGLKAAQRNVVLLDILGVQNLPSSFAYLLTIQGIGTLIGPPVSGFLKDHYGKYDYAFYFGGVAVILGSFILAYGNLRNHCSQKNVEADNSTV